MDGRQEILNSHRHVYLIVGKPRYELAGATFVFASTARGDSMMIRERAY